MKPAQIKSCSFSSYSAATNEPFVLATTDVADADNEQVTTEELTLAGPTDSSSTANSDAAVTLHENKLVNRFLSNTSLSASEYGTDKTIKQTRSSEDEACCSVEILELGSGTGPEHEGSVAELTTSFFLARTDSTMTFAATLALLTWWRRDPALWVTTPKTKIYRSWQALIHFIYVYMFVVYKLQQHRNSQFPYNIIEQQFSDFFVHNGHRKVAEQ